MKLLFIDKNQWLIDYLESFISEKIIIAPFDYFISDKVTPIDFGEYDIVTITFYKNDENYIEKLDLIKITSLQSKLLVLVQNVAEDQVAKIAQQGISGIIDIESTNQKELAICLNQINKGGFYFSKNIEKQLTSNKTQNVAL